MNSILSYLLKLQGPFRIILNIGAGQERTRIQEESINSKSRELFLKMVICSLPVPFQINI